MENFTIFIDYIARTNLFNFTIFLSIIIFLLKKINVSKQLDDTVLAINNSIEESENVRVESEKNLLNVETSIANLSSEINDIFEKSSINAKLVGEKILEDAQKVALVVKENSEKTILSNNLLLKNDLLQRASKASIEVAQSHILRELERNENLHDKLIDESLESINNLSIEGME